VHLLEKIAQEPVPFRISEFSAGGGPGKVYDQMHKLFCNILTADPGTVPLVQTFFIFPHGKYCASKREVLANEATFKRQVREAARGIGRRPAIVLLDLDSVATSSCLGRGALPVWESELRFEVDQFQSLPHTVVYAEAGYSDANRPKYTARVLNAIGIRKIRGFYTNDTHHVWTIDEVHWAQKVSGRTGGAHFIVNTAENGTGQLRTRHPHRQGNEVLCNPPGRALGPRPTTATGSPLADAWLWTYEPGKSSGSCHGGPRGGTFWPARAYGEAERANEKLGPGYPSRPY
jgi:endoglucanase